MVGFLVAAAGICVACITVYLALVDRGGML